MKHFAGLDVSLEETAICVIDEAGTMVREARVPSEPEALVAFFQGPGLVMERIGLEACSLSAWLHEGLVAAGLGVTIYPESLIGFLGRNVEVRPIMHPLFRIRTVLAWKRSNRSRQVREFVDVAKLAGTR